MDPIDLINALTLRRIKKGGPGGGRHSSPGSASRSANLKSKLAEITGKQNYHARAAAAHRLASRLHLAAGNFAAAAHHAERAGRHEEMSKR
jgi:hypothetical protein